MEKHGSLCRPHFYATDSLELDAKGMDIHKVAIVKGGVEKTLKYEYDGWLLNIKLDKTYKGGEQYTIYIDYTAKARRTGSKRQCGDHRCKRIVFHQSERRRKR